MHVKLPPGQEEFIQQKIADGNYASADAVISDAIHLLQQQELWAGDAAAKIEQGWDEAKSGTLISEETLILHLKTRKAAWRSAHSGR